MLAVVVVVHIQGLPVAEVLAAVELALLVVLAFPGLQTLAVEVEDQVLAAVALRVEGVREAQA
jgi:hypothetical protein